MTYPIDVQKIVSMIVQDLRQFNHGAIVDIVKKADYSLEFVDHDNWNGGIDYFKLCFHLKYSDFSKPLEQNDITKAKSLIARGKYVEVLGYMLQNNMKLEQEIISWHG